jgi:hypothetical protein
MAAGYCFLSVVLSSEKLPMADARMRVAVAGTNELALLIAAFIMSETSYQLIILSRHVCTVPATCLALESNFLASTKPTIRQISSPCCGLY